MAELIELPTHADSRGALTVIDGILPFEIKRVYFVYGLADQRGGHRHHRTRHAAVAVSGSCRVDVDDGTRKCSFDLERPDQCLILEPHEWRTLSNFSGDAIILFMTSTHYDADDYVYEPYG